MWDRVCVVLTHTVIAVGNVSCAFSFQPVYFEKGTGKEVFLFLISFHAVFFMCFVCAFGTKIETDP